MKNNVPGFDSLGFCVAIDDGDRFAYLMKTVWAGSDSYPALRGECGAFSEDYLRVWTHIDGEEINQVLESNPMPGLVASVDSYVGSDLIKAWVWDRDNQDSEEPLYPICFYSPMPWMITEAQAKASTQPLSITVLGTSIEIFENEEELKQHPELGRFAAECVIPTGLFGEEKNEAPRTGVLVIGKVLLAVNPENTLTGEKYHALRVRTLGGEVWVALPEQSVDGDVDGKIVAVQGIASGSFPYMIPEKIEEEADGEGFSFDNDAVEPKLRDLCIEFFKGGEPFDDYFGDLHCGRIEKVLSLIFFVFSAARNMIKNRGKRTPELAKRYEVASKNAPIVFARIVMANTMILYKGLSSPALVVVAFGEGAEDVMDEARKVLSRIHFGDTQNDQEKELAELIDDETYRFGTRRRLPKWLVGNVEAYAADLWIPKAAIFEQGLISEVIVCLAEPGPEGLTAALPSDLITRAMRAAKGPPPIPSKPE